MYKVDINSSSEPEKVKEYNAKHSMVEQIL